MRTIILCIAAAAIFGGGPAWGEDSEKLTFDGRVVDTNGQPIAESIVRLYEGEYAKLNKGEPLEILGEQKTKENGEFSFSVAKESTSTVLFILTAEKDGFALGWITRSSRGTEKSVITLGMPSIFVGLVVDSNEKAIPDAEVGIFAITYGEQENRSYLSSIYGQKLLNTKTDESGKFIFIKIPDGAKAEFIVKKAGYATKTTFSGGEYNNLKYMTNQGDIKIILPAESTIEGKVVEKETGKEIADVNILARAEYVPIKPVVSGADGTFRIEGLPAGKITLWISSPGKKLPEWVIEPFEVNTEEGKTTSGVEIKLSKGGILEVVVTEAENKKAIAEAHISLHPENSRQYAGGQTDSNGLARMRLLPGKYVFEGVYHRSFTSERKQSDVIIEEGNTVRVAIEMQGMPKKRGVVRDNSGRPVEGAEVRLHPMSQNIIKTDANGLFELAWDKRMWGNQEIDFYAVVRAKKENLAWMGPVDDNANQIEIKLTPALTFTGRVVDVNRNPIEGAKINLMARFGNYGSNLDDEKNISDKDGRFELKCIPDELDCTVSAQASGYSKEQMEAEPEDASNGLLDLGESELREALLTVTGIVVDINDAPVANAQIYSYGPHQPDKTNIKTDSKGQFTIDKVCDGELHLQANSSSSTGQFYRYGWVRTTGGATDVKIVVSEQGMGRRTSLPKPASLVDKAIPAMVNLGFKDGIEDANDKPILLCFFDVQQRPSRQALKELTAMTETLKEKGIIVVGVQCSTIKLDELDEQLKKAGVTFKAGMIGADEEKVKRQWGVDGLPWLILTDKQHIVKAGGFEVADINEKLKELE